MNVSEHSLKNPTPEFVTTVYATCLQQVTNLNEHSFQPVVQRALQQLDNTVCSSQFSASRTLPQLRTCTRPLLRTTFCSTICMHS